MFESKSSLIKVPKLLVHHLELQQRDFVMSHLQQRLHCLLSELTAFGVTLQRQCKLYTCLKILEVSITYLKLQVVHKQGKFIILQCRV